MTDERRPQYERANVTMSYAEAAGLLHGTLSDQDTIRLAKRLDKARNDYVESTLGIRDGRRVWLYLTDGREFDGVLRRVYGTYRWSIVESDDTCGSCGRGEPTVVEFTANDVAEVCNGATGVTSAPTPALRVGALVRRTESNMYARTLRLTAGTVGTVRSIVGRGSVVVDLPGYGRPVFWISDSFEVIG